MLVAGSGAPARVAERNAEISSPPYLFTGPRPQITAEPPAVAYGATFAVETPNGADISAVRLIRLGSVTHSFDQNQRLVTLAFTVTPCGRRVKAHADGSAAAPGHCKLLVPNRAGVPSVAKIVSVTG